MAALGWVGILSKWRDRTGLDHPTHPRAAGEGVVGEKHKHKWGSYHDLVEHMKRHNVKRWILDGCDREDAQTIRHAVRHTSSQKIIEALAECVSHT